MSDKNSFLVFSGTNSRYLAEKICASLGCPLGNLVVTKFSDGEFGVSFEESIRGRDVFLVQSTFPNSDNLMETGPQRQTSCKHWRQARCRLAECGWNRPSDNNGPPCRPNSGLLRCTS